MDLTTYIKKLEHAGEIIRIREEVTPHFEITEIADRFSKQMGGGKALLFERTGTEYAVLINALGSESRIRIAFGDRSPDDLADEIQKMISILAGGDSGF